MIRATAAFATLFQRRNVVLTPSPATDADALRRVADLWRACGAQVRTLDAGMHDRIFAAVSHLPHLLAFALVEELAMRPDAEDIFRYAASGFRDFHASPPGRPRCGATSRSPTGTRCSPKLPRFAPNSTGLPRC
jgi:prephenate dehydrogenase